MTKTVKKASEKSAVKKPAKPETQKKNIVKKTEKVSVVKKNQKTSVLKKKTVVETKASVKKTVAKKAPVKTAKVAPKKAAKKVVPAKTKTAVKIPTPQPVKIEKKAVSASANTIKKDEFLKKLRLPKADKKFFRDLLLHARAQFGQQVKFHSEDALSSHKDSAGERAGMATHMADLGTDNYRHDYELQLMSEEVDVLEMIDEALQRLEDSEYGVCLDCGEQIPRKRLEAKPYARYCTKCKSIREQMDEDAHRR